MRSKTTRRPKIYVIYRWIRVRDGHAMAETVVFDDDEKDELVRQATYVVDLLDRRLLKCREDDDHDRIVEWIFDRYGKEISSALFEWRRRERRRSENEEHLRAIVGDRRLGGGAGVPPPGSGEVRRRI